jgi:diacylglycerol kinase (ATP)
VAAGGDGTVSAVANGLVHAEKPLAIVPLGTGNSLAQELGIPRNLDEAVDLLIGDHGVRRIDVLRLGERLTVLNVGVGLGAQVMDDTGSDEKRHLGFFAYVWKLVHRLLGFHLQPFEIGVDGQRHRVRAAEVMVLNSAVVGLAEGRWTSGVRLDDGRVAVLAMRARTLLDLARVGWNVLFRRGAPDPGMRKWTARREVTIHTEPPLGVQVDGDVVGETPIDITLLPGALAVIAPRR